MSDERGAGGPGDDYDDHDDPGRVPAPKEGMKGTEATEEAEPTMGEVEELRALLDAEKRRSDDYLTRLRYLQADFDNYRKRTEREVKEVADFSTVRLMRKLLPVVDELELAVASAGSSGAEGNGAILEGVTMVLKNLNGVLEGEGLKRIEAVGRPFNPEFHEAVERVEGRRAKSDTVVEEVRRGFLFRDRVLRPSMVKVELAAKSHDKNSGGMEEVGEHE